MEQSNNQRSNTFVLILAVCALLASAMYIWRFTQGPGDKRELWHRELGPVAARTAAAVVAVETERQTRISSLIAKNAGSGFILDSDGYIVTNEHVVCDADGINIKLADGRRFFAVVVGSDKRADIAVLKIDAEGLTALEYGDIDQLAAGQVVIALGNPFGSGADGKAVTTFGQIIRLDQRLGQGLDSANDRFYDNLIQTDAVTEPGNSGGPLVDENGRAIGILTAMGVGIDYRQHYGFAITLDETTRTKIAQLKAGHLVGHAFLGVQTTEIDRLTRRRLGIKDVSGALVTAVLPGAPAQKAGIRPGDVIRSVDGARVYSPTDLIARVDRILPGRLAEIILLRGRAGRSRELTIVAELDIRMSADLRGYMHEARQPSSVTAWGMQAKPLTRWRRRKMKLHAQQQGMLVYRVEPGSPAQRYGIEPGMVITQIGQYRIDTVGDFDAAAKKYRVLPRIATVPTNTNDFYGEI